MISKKICFCRDTETQVDLNMSKQSCHCGFAIKEIDDALYKTEYQILSYSNNPSEKEWSQIDIDLDRIKMALNSASKACGISLKNEKDAYTRLSGNLPYIDTEKGRKDSISIINRIHQELYQSLENCE